MTVEAVRQNDQTDISTSMSTGEILQETGRRWPDSPAVTFEGRTFTWKETAERSRRMANALAGYGVVAEDRVAYLGFNSHQFFEMFYAPSLVGATLVPINFRLSRREMLECLEDSEPKVLVADGDHLEHAQALAAACPSIELVVNASARDTPEGMRGYEDLIAAVSTEPQGVPGRGDDLLVLFYTGGTTGRAKGVMLTHANLLANARGTTPFYELLEQETHLLAAPMFHTAAGSRVFTAATLALHTVIISRFEPVEVMEAVQNYHINGVQFVPTMLQMILEHPRLPEFDLRSLRMISYGAAPMPIALMQRAIEKFPGIRFYQAYGMTEASPVVSMLRPDDHVLSGPATTRLKSVGKPAPYVDIQIVDTNGKELADGETGEVVVRGANVMHGYWRAPEQTAAVLRNGWYHTGDSGYFDEEGYLVLAGRIKDMIVSGGENVYPIEVENVLLHHPAVGECAVIGIAHERWGEAVHAVVRLRNGHAALTESELIEYCRANLAHYKCPVSISMRDEPMPMSGVNKILKTELRKEYGVSKGALS